MIHPEAEKQINLVVVNLLRSLEAAYSALHDTGVKVVSLNVSPTEFDRETIWWVEPEGIAKNPHSQADVDCYYRLTNIPPDKAMLSLTVDSDKVNLCFMPKKPPADKSTPKLKGFGR